MSQRDALENFEHAGLQVFIYPDEDPSNPRKDEDNFGTLACWHRRYDLGDEQRRDEPDAFIEGLAEEFDPNFTNRWDNAIWLRMVGHDVTGEDYKTKQAAFEKARHAALWKVINRHYLILPLGLIDHSGIAMYIGSGAHLCDPGGWDSGQVGWIYVTKKKARGEFKGKRYLVKARECLEAEVKRYSLYLEGGFVGFVVEDENGEHLDSCWGFDDIDYCREEAKQSAESEAKHCKEQDAKIEEMMHL